MTAGAQALTPEYGPPPEPRHPEEPYVGPQVRFRESRGQPRLLDPNVARLARPRGEAGATGHSAIRARAGGEIRGR